MYLVWIGVILLLMKWLEVEPVSSLSWWWILLPLALALAWFEVFEKMFGRDKQTVEHIEYEEKRRKRVEATFFDPKKANSGAKSAKH